MTTHEQANPRPTPLPPLIDEYVAHTRAHRSSTPSTPAHVHTCPDPFDCMTCWDDALESAADHFVDVYGVPISAATRRVVDGRGSLSDLNHPDTTALYALANLWLDGLA